MADFKKNLVTIFLVVGVVIYQGANLYLSQGFAPSQLARVGVSINDGKLKTPFLPVLVLPDTVYRLVDSATIRYQAFDFSSSALAGLGYIARYLGRQVPEMMAWGRQGKLQSFYYRDEVTYQFPYVYDQILANSQRNLSEYLSVLHRKKIHTVLLFLPTQLSIQRGLYSSLHNPDVWMHFDYREKREEPEYAHRVWRQIAPEQTPDIFSTFIRFHEGGLGPEYLYGEVESHWSSLGVSVAVREVMKNLFHRKLVSSVPNLRFVGFREPFYRHDYLRRLLLPEWYIKQAAELKWREPMFEVEQTAPSGFSGRVFLAGTSFSDRYKKDGFSLAAILGKALGGKKVRDYSSEGLSVGEALRQIGESPDSLRPGDLLVVEVPIKFAASHFRNTLVLPHYLTEIKNKKELRASR